MLTLLLSTCCSRFLVVARTHGSCWDVETGRQAQNINVSDVRWKTHTCVLGFNVMGIWPPYSDGTDINAVDCNAGRGICVTGGDDGLVRLANYPCVVKHAPNRETTGHSSHVMNVKLMRNGQLLMSVGGHDETVMVYDVLPLTDLADDSFDKLPASGTGTGGVRRFARSRPAENSRRSRTSYEPTLG